MTGFTKTLLCVDSDSFKHPEVIGLDDENLAAQPWLRVFSSAQDARLALSGDASLGTAWVVSSDDMEGINLAAALKLDRSECDVSLVSFGCSGSELGRCQAAGVGLLRGRNAFVQSYSERKALAATQDFKEIRGVPIAESAYAGIESTANESKKILNDENDSLRRKGDASAEGDFVWLNDSAGLMKPGRTKQKISAEADEAGGLVELDLDDPLARSAEAQERVDLAYAGGSPSGHFAKSEIAKPERGGSEVPERSFSTRKSRHLSSSAASAPSQEELISRVVFQPIKTDKTAFVVSVVGGNGGVGKSTVASCAATMLQARGLKTLLIDVDLQFGDMGFLLGKEDAFDIADLMAQPERLAQLEPKDGLPALICSPRKLEQSELIMNRIAEFIEYLKAFFDVIVVNTGAFWSESHIQVIEVSDKVLFMLDQRPSSVRSCSHALELCARCGIATQQFQYVLNFCSRHALLTSLDVSCALQGVHVEELKDGGKEVGELLGAGLPLELLESKNVFIDSLGKLMGQILPEALLSIGSKSKDELAPKRRYVFGGFRKRRAACL